MLNTTVHREITPLAPEDSFLVFDRIKDQFDFPIHFHPEYELNFIANGKGVRRVVGDSMEVIENIELVLVGPNLQHGWEMHECSNSEIHEITLQFHEDLFDDKLLARRIMKPIKDMFDRSTHGILFSEKISDEISPRIMQLSKIDSIDYFLELISILHDLATSRNQRLLSTYTSDFKNFENSDKLKTIYEYIQLNYQNKISLSEVAELVNMSQVSFNRFIKKRTGKTLIEYVNDTRIGYAARWLIERDLSIAEIAFKCGFNNIANFNRVFKKTKNCTPSKYRDDFSGIKRVL
ncbi:AraC family transcriptional regulator [Zunongwangia atlantica]|uniref:Helix-turn-helix domain-containing protein n=1 Tax=Zunongwangia atlantica 22II14-10F7 TaxID=1185767 RepID=A0A1Y1T2T7_9FLAO|nr:AraC family transcriptional regulator [Zunongwangia atlantica]ORL44905.1 helix-turn-helix domain-containing protein [Zunongwangia atlantica 22II14-10F7]